MMGIRKGGENPPPVFKRPPPLLSYQRDLVTLVREQKWYEEAARLLEELDEAQPLTKLLRLLVYRPSSW